MHSGIKGHWFSNQEQMMIKAYLLPLSFRLKSSFFWIQFDFGRLCCWGESGQSKTEAPCPDNGWCHEWLVGQKNGQSPSPFRGSANTCTISLHVLSVFWWIHSSSNIFLILSKGIVCKKKKKQLTGLQRAKTNPCGTSITSAADCACKAQNYNVRGLRCRYFFPKEGSLNTVNRQKLVLSTFV